MKALLDTHVFLWWILDDKRLSTTAREVIGSENSDLYMSAASIWEMVIKIRIGKLTLPDPPLPFIEEQLRINHLKPLAITISHAMSVHHLPLIHRDPFDRMLVAQSKSEKMAVVTGDRLFAGYDVRTIW